MTMNGVMAADITPCVITPNAPQLKADYVKLVVATYRPRPSATEMQSKNLVFSNI